ncbi:AlpA family phage regulatory protein [Halospina sp. K52047b]|uniref:AlpA family phage regulatory protein n=1 Tax=Halospina sp. K52047b TaxID=2614160 RepID=UPI001249C684|nr:AlpA family phage regulatory protein [Halospina sp. K52047b]KAA8985194.1 AlpA family phage regulatory protein [Halospina sp. K52047b]
MSDNSKATRIIRLKEVIKRTALSQSTIYNKLNPGSKQYDPEFPKQVRLGVGAVGWYEEQIEKWLLTRQ